MKATLLTVNDLYGYGGLNTINNIGTKAQSTDFAMATGVKDSKYYLKTTSTNSRNLENYKCTFYIVDKNGRVIRRRFQDETIGIRPVLEFSSIEEMDLLTERIGTDKIKCGEYAEDSFSEDEQNKWEDEANLGLLEKCGSYTLDSKIIIYENNRGKKAVKLCINNDYRWLEVKDKIWYLDRNSLKAVSDKIILGGIKFTESGYYFDENSFSDTNINQYLNNIFLPELMQFNKNYKIVNSIINGAEAEKNPKLEYKM